MKIKGKTVCFIRFLRLSEPAVVRGHLGLGKGHSGVRSIRVDVHNITLALRRGIAKHQGLGVRLNISYLSEELR